MQDFYLTFFLIDSNGKNFKSFTINPKYSGIQCPGNRGKLTDTDVEKINKYYKQECDSRGLQFAMMDYFSLKC